MVIFNSYVSLPEGKQPIQHQPSLHDCHFGVYPVLSPTGSIKLNLYSPDVPNQFSSFYVMMCSKCMLTLSTIKCHLNSRKKKKKNIYHHLPITYAGPVPWKSTGEWIYWCVKHVGLLDGLECGLLGWHETNVMTWIIPENSLRNLRTLVRLFSASEKRIQLFMVAGCLTIFHEVHL